MGFKINFSTQKTIAEQLKEMKIIYTSRKDDKLGLADIDFSNLAITALFNSGLISEPSLNDFHARAAIFIGARCEESKDQKKVDEAIAELKEKLAAATDDFSRAVLMKKINFLEK